MARYKILEPTLIGNDVLEAGTEIGDGTAYPFDGYPGPNLEPLDDEGHAKAAELVEINRQRISEMQAANPFSPTIDPQALGVAIGKAVAEALAAQAAEQRDLNDRVVAALERLGAAQPDAAAPAADATADAGATASATTKGKAAAAPAADASATT